MKIILNKQINAIQTQITIQFNLKLEELIKKR